MKEHHIVMTSQHTNTAPPGAEGRLARCSSWDALARRTGAVEPCVQPQSAFWASALGPAPPDGRCRMPGRSARARLLVPSPAAGPASPGADATAACPSCCRPAEPPAGGASAGWLATCMGQHEGMSPGRTDSLTNHCRLLIHGLRQPHLFQLLQQRVLPLRELPPAGADQRRALCPKQRRPVVQQRKVAAVAARPSAPCAATTAAARLPCRGPLAAAGRRVLLLRVGAPPPPQPVLNVRGGRRGRGALHQLHLLRAGAPPPRAAPAARKQVVVVAVLGACGRRRGAVSAEPSAATSCAQPA